MLRPSRALLALAATGLMLASTPASTAAAQTSPEQEPPSLFGRPVHREGFHLHVGFGLGGGPNDLFGLHHTMEIGGTFDNGVTVALLHTFIQNRGIGDNVGGPDLIGAWLAELKVPFFVPELVGKIGFGLGGEHDQSDGIRVIPGLGWAYGFDLHFPVERCHGPTLGVTMLHTLAEGRHQVGLGVSLGWTLF